MKSICSENLATPTGYDNLSRINLGKGDECGIVDATDAHETELIEEIERLEALLRIREKEEGDIIVNPEEKVKMLVSEFHYLESTARAFVESEGICPYCGEDLLSSRLGYSSIVIDHLLPKSKYPDLEWDQRNLVACCSSCNSMKHKLDIMDNIIDYNAALNKKQDLINMVRESLYQKIFDRPKEYIRVTQIIRNIKLDV